MANQEYVRQYSAFRGVDFTSDPADVADYRVQNSVNMWRDYENGNGDMIETIPGFRCIIPTAFESKGTITHGIHHYRTTDKGGNIIDYMIIHMGARLLAFDTKTMFRSTLKLGNDTEFMSDRKSLSVMANNRLWLIDGEKYLYIQPGENGLDVYSAAGEGGIAYVPTVYLDGKQHEARNLLNDNAKEGFNNAFDSEPLYILVKPSESIPEVANYALYCGFETIVSVKLGSEYLSTIPNGSSIPDGYYYHVIVNESSGDKFVQIIKYRNGSRAAMLDDDLKGNELIVEGKLHHDFAFAAANKYPSFTSETVRGDEAIIQCTKIAVFDGKVFLTGNPKLPNTVFFSSTNSARVNDPTYFGSYNFIDTGIGMSMNNAMVASQGTLMVFKGDTAQDGSIYYLTPFDTGLSESVPVPRFYTVTEGNVGIGCIGRACNFMDDVVFISKRGLDAVGKQLTNLERSIVHRSTMVDRKLLGDDIKNAVMVEWKGYLVISVGGHIYMADSRSIFADSTGNAQYEWFYIEGVGDYKDTAKKRVIRYMSGSADEFNDLEYSPSADDADQAKVGSYEINHAMADEIVGENIPLYWDMLDVNGTSFKQWYTAEKDGDGNIHYYLLYEDEEWYPDERATFYPATEMCVINDVLYFATDLGKIYCFNTDKRGEIPESIYKDGEFVDSDYDNVSEFVGWIPQDYYTFDGRRYVSGVITKTDNAGIPYATKDTVNRSLVIRCGADPRTHSTVVVEVSTNRKAPFIEVDRKDSTESTFGMKDFSASSFDTYPFAFLVFREKERKWVEKKYKIYNDSYKGILRLHSLSYRYSLGGKIK